MWILPKDKLWLPHGTKVGVDIQIWKDLFGEIEYMANEKIHKFIQNQLIWHEDNWDKDMGL